MRNELDVKKRDEIVGDDIVITLPFKCEEEMVEQGVEGHTNTDKEIRKRVLGKQVFYILSMTFVSVDKLERDEQKASFCIYESPVKQTRSKKTSDFRKRKKKEDSFESAREGGDEMEEESDDSDLSESDDDNTEASS